MDLISKNNTNVLIDILISGLLIQRKVGYLDKVDFKIFNLFGIFSFSEAQHQPEMRISGTPERIIT